jgi:hypothetical protein
VILNQGVKGDGTFTWMEIDRATGPVRIGSVFAPASRSKHIQFWRWLLEFTQTDKWILLGDMNMVEMHDDLIGLSAVVHGTESQVWKRLVDQLDLLDFYFCAGNRKGPVHTR